MNAIYSGGIRAGCHPVKTVSDFGQWRAKNFFGRIEYQPIRQGPPAPPECPGQMGLAL